MPRQKANEMIIKYQTNDPLKIASYENIRVVPWALHEEIKGFYKYIRRSKYIFYNIDLNEAMKRFVCAHELGHALLHPRSNTPFLRASTLFSIDKIEVEANRFAVELLMPDEELAQHQNISLYDAACIFGLPQKLIKLKKGNFF